MTPQRPNPMITIGIGNYSLIFVGVVIALSAFFIFIKKPKSDLHRAFLIFALGGALWMASIGLLSLTKNFAFEQIIDFGGAIFIFGFFLIALSIPVPMKFRIHPIFLLAPAVIDMVFVIPSGLINVGMIVKESGSIVPIPGPLLVVHALYGVIYTLLGIGILIYKLGRSHGIEKLRIKYLFLATSIFATVSVIFDAVLPALGISNFNLLGPLSSILFIGITAYAIVRHELMDIRIVIQRSLIYTVLFGLISVFYLSLINLIGFFLGQESIQTIITAGIITTALGVFTIPSLERFFRKRTDSFFFKDKYDYADALRELSEIVYTTIEFESLVDQIERTLERIFRTDEVKLNIHPQKILREMYENPETKILLYGNPNMLTIHVPIALGQDEIGSIFCGEKRSGEVYTSEDVKLLETFAYQAATALSRAKFYLEIKNHAENLESNVAARTKDLRKAQEHQKQMMLEISHNLQTPLAIFQTKIEQLKQKKRLNPEVAGFEQSLKDLSSFIYSLLTLAKIENRPEPPTITTFNVSELVRDIAEEMSIIAENSNIKLATDITRDIFIMGNPKELREAILNMLSNAVKYMHPTGIREIRIDLKKIGGVARLSIADTGVGINQTDVDQLFERFYRVKNSGNSIGTGLGLAITKRIVDYHHGKIWCESKKGSGTTFYVDVPLAESERTYWGG